MLGPKGSVETDRSCYWWSLLATTVQFEPYSARKISKNTKWTTQFHLLERQCAISRCNKQRCLNETNVVGARMESPGFIGSFLVNTARTTRYTLLEEVQKFVDEWIDSKNKYFYRRGLHLLPKRWTKVVENR